ncbi:hypothetical protein [Vulcanisaeta souniana]|uniref:Uncharacterized protein n=1 Tax=Vulcanisaeta souniana JCM 11219 TaxID=1293586 RepID=A0A830EAH1_9CREN|nr:hypothetical protein [Vulcanisaeta souniana]BDR91036.1 hypothetical protein Vsou_01290 [Vulcanisaeta souniana JCM 11219]GGI80298.1 hypothetical protein GCM10007112_16440 [Vulcanisaeta souniana JCM 11219]
MPSDDADMAKVDEKRRRWVEDTVKENPVLVRLDGGFCNRCVHSR